MGLQQDDIVARIKAIQCTRVESTIADYILCHLDVIGLEPLLDLAKQIGVSDTSIIRFVRKLGFKGYAEFRASMNSRMSEQAMKNRNMLPGERFIQTRDKLKENTLCKDVASLVLENIEETFKVLDEQLVAQVADILLASHRKFIVGMRSTASVASYLSKRLVLLLPDVHEIFNADSKALQTIVDCEKDDCLIVFSFPRYSEMVGNVIQIASKRNAKIILITDSQTQELAHQADIVIPVKIQGLGFANCYVAPAVLVDMILLTVSVRGQDKCRERIQLIDSLVSRTKLY